MINYILLAVTIACTIFNVWLTIKDRGYNSGYDKGLEDGIRMTNEVLEEDKTDFEDKPYLYRDMDGYLDEWDESQTDCPWR